MFRLVRSYFWLCICRAWVGALSSALNWGGILGAGVLGILLEYRASQITFGEGWQGVVLSGVAYTAAAWVVIFIVRLILVAPFLTWRDQKDRADKSEGLRQIAEDVSLPPSFEIGFESAPFQFPEVDRNDFVARLEHHPICRIWVENTEARPIEECRVVVESFTPDAPIRNGSLLVPDEHERTPSVFHLAATEKRYFEFLEYSGFLGDSAVIIKTDHDGTGFSAILNRKHLEKGNRYFATIGVHGKNAGSKRINLIIDIGESEVVVSQATSQLVGELA